MARSTAKTPARKTTAKSAKTTKAKTARKAKPARAARAAKAARPAKSARTARASKPARAAKATRTKKPARAAKAAPKARKTTRAARPAKAAPAKVAVKVTATPSGKSDKDHLIAVIKDSAGCSAAAAKSTLDNLVGTISSTLKKNQKVQIYGFGTFAVAKRPARMGRNPKTGEKIRLKASKSVRFRAGKALKETV